MQNTSHNFNPETDFVTQTTIARAIEVFPSQVISWGSKYKVYPVTVAGRPLFWRGEAEKLIALARKEKGLPPLDAPVV